MSIELWCLAVGALLGLALWAFLRARAWVQGIDIRVGNAEADAKLAYERSWKATHELDDIRDHLDLTYSTPGRARLVKRS